MSFPPDDPRSAAQAIDALRRGWPVVLTDGGAGRALHLLAVETADNAALAAFDAAGVGDRAGTLLLSGERAATLKLINQQAAAGPGPVLIGRRDGEGIAAAMAVADPARDLETPLKGPFTSLSMDGWPGLAEAVMLLRHAGLLPAAFVRVGPPDGPLRCSLVAARAYADDPRLFIAARARLPVEAAVSGEIVAFRSRHDGREHVALIVGARDATVPVARLHSECLTGDVFGSLKCDCGPQLQRALHDMAADQWGVLLYLRQEGRGIGLVNKLRAYALQDQGYDTVEANLRLGFPVESRDFATAAAMLRLLEIPTVRLMTNNPAKVARMRDAGITVSERLPLILPANPHNAAYLATKRDRTGHLL